MNSLLLGTCSIDQSQRSPAVKNVPNAGHKSGKRCKRRHDTWPKRRKSSGIGDFRNWKSTMHLQSATVDDADEHADDSGRGSSDLSEELSEKKSISSFLKSLNIFDYYGKGGSNEAGSSRSSISTSLDVLMEDLWISWESPFAKQQKKAIRGNGYRTASSSQLIQLDRPSNLPPKSVVERERHEREYRRMVEAAKRKDVEREEADRKRRMAKLREEEELAATAAVWTREILPNWHTKKNDKRTRDLWWKGLPPCVRGKVWSLTIGNKLNITRQAYAGCVEKSNEILKRISSSEMASSCESSVELIRLDISRTFPHLYIFQKGGPYYDVLHSLLGAYVVYQPDVGYVQGMSFIAAVFLLNMGEVDAFVCFANLLEWPCHKVFFSLNVPKMRCYYAAYTDLLRQNLPILWEHFDKSSLTPDLYLVDWIYTLFSKSANLDLASRIWDLVLRDGDEFIFKAALGVMRLCQQELLKMDFLHAAQYLTKLPEDLSPDLLFKSISHIRINIGTQTFQDIVDHYEKATNGAL